MHSNRVRLGGGGSVAATLEDQFRVMSMHRDQTIDSVGTVNPSFTRRAQSITYDLSRHDHERAATHRSRDTTRVKNASSAGRHTSDLDQAWPTADLRRPGSARWAAAAARAERDVIPADGRRARATTHHRSSHDGVSRASSSSTSTSSTSNASSRAQLMNARSTSFGVRDGVFAADASASVAAMSHKGSNEPRQALWHAVEDDAECSSQPTRDGVLTTPLLLSEHLDRRRHHRSTRHPSHLYAYGEEDVLTNDDVAAVTPITRAMCSRSSRLLLAFAENVAHLRGVAAPVRVEREVQIAFDKFLASGTTMLKFVSRNSAPHARFFIVRFLDENDAQLHSVSQAVFCWYRTQQSLHMRQFFPLQDLVRIVGGGEGHPFVRCRQVRKGVLKGRRSGLHREYLHDRYILQFCFRSNAWASGEVVVVAQAPNVGVFLAWQVFGEFISHIRSPSDRYV